MNIQWTTKTLLPKKFPDLYHNYQYIWFTYIVHGLSTLHPPLTILSRKKYIKPLFTLLISAKHHKNAQQSFALKYWLQHYSCLIPILPTPAPSSLNYYEQTKFLISLTTNNINYCKSIQCTLPITFKIN